MSGKARKAGALLLVCCVMLSNYDYKAVLVPVNK